MVVGVVAWDAVNSSCCILVFWAKSDVSEGGDANASASARKVAAPSVSACRAQVEGSSVVPAAAASAWRRVFARVSTPIISSSCAGVDAIAIGAILLGAEVVLSASAVSG